MLDQIGDYLDGTWLSHTFAALDWFVPAVQTIHLLGIAVVLSTVLMLDTSLLGVAGGKRILSALSGDFLSWTWRALLLLVVTGVLLVIAEPKRELSSMAFRVKMFLVVLLAITTLISQTAVLHRSEHGDASPRRRRIAGAVALVSVMLCIAIVTAGRFIAYGDHE